MAEHEEQILEEHQRGEGEYTRKQTRSLIFHVLYVLEGFDYDNTLAAVVENLNRGYDQQIKPDGEIVTTAQTIVDQRDYLDTVIQQFLEHWRLNRLGVCTKLILRMGVWELLFTDTPTSIIINEAIELAKDFAEKDAYKFVNGLLDKVASKRDELRESLKK